METGEKEKSLGKTGGQQSYKPKTSQLSGFLVLAIAVVLGFGWFGLYYLTNPSSIANQKPQHQIARNSNQQQSNKATELRKKEQTSSEHACDDNCQKESRTDRADLHAQRGMWRATNVVAVVAFCQLIATFIGLYWIYRTMTATGTALGHTRETLNQTRVASGIAHDTLSENRKANALQTRPFLAVQKTKVSYHETRNQYMVAVKFDIDITNLGVVPAYNFFIQYIPRTAESQLGNSLLMHKKTRAPLNFIAHVKDASQQLPQPYIYKYPYRPSVINPSETIKVCLCNVFEMDINIIGFSNFDEFIRQYVKIIRINAALNYSNYSNTVRFQNIIFLHENCKTTSLSGGNEQLKQAKGIFGTETEIKLGKTKDSYQY